MASPTTTAKNQPVTSWIDTPPGSPAIRHLNGQFLARLPWLDKVSTALKARVDKLYGEPGQPAYKIKDILNGVWLGHPIHPALVTFPIGAWSASLVLDLAWLSDEDEGVAKSADLLMWLGLGSAVGAAATGITNWLDIDGPPQRAGMLHGLLNGGVTLLNLTSGVLRITGQRRTAISLAATAFALTIYSAYLGGELAYSSAINVNRVAVEGGSDDFVAVIAEEDLVPGKLTRVDAAGIPAVLFKDKHGICAIAATCSHLGGPLDEGRYEDGVVYCPWHNSGFSMCDGNVMNSPAVYAQPTFAVRTRDGQVEVRRLEQA